MRHGRQVPSCPPSSQPSQSQASRQLGPSAGHPASQPSSLTRSPAAAAAAKAKAKNPRVHPHKERPVWTRQLRLSLAIHRLLLLRLLLPMPLIPPSLSRWQPGCAVVVVLLGATPFSPTVILSGLTLPIAHYASPCIPHQRRLRRAPEHC
ncbi:uncharacterized protein B0I36DRAFT_129420 [Microdochium trichocladiopsis]|uniref:Uncharacterized protein n=1 Tax=Microdochium trichocladiopsis TaxID=1682393 RepID=A0A9P8Y3W7_9PEZI|nr:uncharacterized protein B0I36DRAFT_129420 [Microdochium trichocladiopsis]KAH7029206.1 hypothetical protein B0I36DRAFT_129420 [Microdochium trichocladiopsis]